ncbi:MAG: type IX secretion system outer membrane channel protein PorV, partial [Putridiphycobacter sp.]|nr:type IX secretion system outer membrane channel protein PorV [Putridiphycobacter sp.]
TSADANSFHWNTSKLIFSDNEAEVSLSYSPWLRGLVDDIKLSYLSGYKKIGTRHAVGGSLRYFSLGTIIFTNNVGATIVPYNPNEYEVLGGYAFKLSDKMSVGINGKFIFSNLTGQISNGTATSKPGLAGAADLSWSYVNPEILLGGFKSQLSFGAVVSNLGNKMSYTDNSDRDFIPTNLRLGTALKVNFDSYNSITAAVDFNKLLVPTLPFRNPEDQSDIISGKENNVGVIAGALQSFYDAPGLYYLDENNEYVVEKNSKLIEELREINIGGGLEYWYSDILAFRAGYFHESAVKGNRKYLTFGAGLKAYSFGLNLSYLVSVTQNNPLANTVRFSLSFRFGDKNSTKLGEE